jgi:hypothetical protein
MDDLLRDIAEERRSTRSLRTIRICDELERRIIKDARELVQRAGKPAPLTRAQIQKNYRDRKRAKQ